MGICHCGTEAGGYTYFSVRYYGHVGIYWAQEQEEIRAIGAQKREAAQ